MIRTVIEGLGHYLPPRVVTNEELAQSMNTSDEWIVQRTGIRERRYVEDGVGASDLALPAAQKALEQAGLAPTDLDLIIFATLSPDVCFPGSACFLQARLGCRPIAALDIRTQCSGFLYGLQIADAFLRTGTYRHVLLVGAEVHSTGLDFSDRGRDVTVLFGDGAGAVVLGAREGAGLPSDSGVLCVRVCADGTGAKELWCVAPTSARMPRLTHKMLEDGLHFPQMNGRLVFRWATEKMPEAAQQVLDEMGMTANDVRWFVPHQANLRINELVARKLGIPDERCWNNIERYGNTTAATIPIGLSELAESGKLQRGDLLLLAAFGSGFTWGSALIRY
ncbi:MAG: beta-ketoacyl-ACP synthase III [Myxococcales bacterium]|nr:ketoacyl-ACP synthase III [Myxococcota bacterium]MDW8281906.1 beta-ketoacyl-ACP synthase III [Myxococcales bacterium]